MRQRMLGLTALCSCVAALAACSKRETPPADTLATPPATTPAPPAPTPAAAITLADVAGKWNMTSVPETGDTTPTKYVLTATSDSAGWKLAFPNGLTVAAHPMASGDSIILRAGPYASVRRKGVQVTTEGAMRRQGDRLVGTTVAHYKTTGPDSVLRLRTEGTRAP